MYVTEFDDCVTVLGDKQLNCLDQYGCLFFFEKSMIQLFKEVVREIDN